MENIRNGKNPYQFFISEPFHVGAWLVDPRTSQLTNQDRSLTLEPLVMDVLCILAASPGAVISKDQFIELAWEGRAVSDNAVSRVIAELRKALQDHPRQPTYIQTISRKGYRLIATVQSHRQPEAPVRTPTNLPSRERPRQKKSPKIFLIATILVAALLGLSYWFLTTPTPAPVPEASGSLSFQPSVVTSRKGIEADPNFSADGRFLLYRHFSAPHAHDGILILRNMEDMEERVVSDPSEDATSPTWNQKQSAFAYLAHSSNQTKVLLCKISPDKETVSPAEVLFQFPKLARQSRIAWAQADQSIVFNQRDHAQAPFQLHTLNPNTGQVTQHTLSQPSGLGDYDFAVHHWDQKVAILRSDVWDATQIIIYDLETRQEKPVLSLPYLVRGISWLDEQTLVFRSPQGLAILDITTETTQLLGQATEPLYRPLVRPQSNQILVMKVTADRDIWVASTLPGEEKTTKAIVSSNRNDFLPRINHGETHLVFVSERSGAQQLWQLDLDHPEKLQQISNFSENMRIKDLKWSPNDRQILLWFDPWKLGIFDISTGQLQTLSPEDAALPSWSHDGQKIFFTSNRNSDWQIWSYSLASKSTTQVTQRGGYVFLANDHAAFLMKFYQPGLWNLDSTTPLLPWPDARFWQSWDLTQETLYFPGETEEFKGVFAYNILGKQIEQAFPLIDPQHSHFSISADGKQFYFDQIARKESDFFLINLPSKLSNRH